MSNVVIGRAIIMPKMPNRAPHIDNDSRMMAELSPMTLPIILGVRMVS